MLLIHYTGMVSFAASRAQLCSPDAKVSAHWLVDEEGGAHPLVPEDARAWHAGVACWEGRADINARSIGIEIQNGGYDFGLPEFPDRQIEGVIALAQGVLARWSGIAPRRVVSHAEVAPARKQDPGERFPWARLAQAGIGLWRDPAPPSSQRGDAAAMRRGLRAWGMCLDDNDDAAFALAVAAFQRHFRPARVDGRADASTLAALDNLLAAL